MMRKNLGGRQRLRRAAVTVHVAVGMTMLCGVTALAVDIGMLYVAKSELQASSDAAALAGAWGLLDEDRLKASPGMSYVVAEARGSAAEFAFKNAVRQVNPVLDLNSANAIDGDIVFGRIDDPTNSSSPFAVSSYASANAVQITVHRDEVRNGPVGLFFARVFGQDFASLKGQATAAFADGIIGFEIPAGSGETADLLPFALHVNVWQQYLAGTKNVGDSFSYDSETKTVSAGSDGVAELNLYPGAGSGQLSPGNFGTVDIGSANNSTADITRQILYGVNAEDLSYFGGKLELNSEGFVNLNGDTGLSAGVKDDLEAIKGQPRTIPLFDQQSGPGNNATFRVVGFAGIRIVHVKLTGSMSSKKVLIQPAICVDPTAISDPGSNASTYVYRPPMLVR